MKSPLFPEAFQNLLPARGLKHLCADALFFSKKEDRRTQKCISQKIFSNKLKYCTTVFIIKLGGQFDRLLNFIGKGEKKHGYEKMEAVFWDRVNRSADSHHPDRLVPNVNNVRLRDHAAAGCHHGGHGNDVHDGSGGNRLDRLAKQSKKRRQHRDTGALHPGGADRAVPLHHHASHGRFWDCPARLDLERCLPDHVRHGDFSQ